MASNIDDQARSPDCGQSLSTQDEITRLVPSSFPCLSNQINRVPQPYSLFRVDKSLLYKPLLKLFYLTYFGNYLHSATLFLEYNIVLIRLSFLINLYDVCSVILMI